MEALRRGCLRVRRRSLRRASGERWRRSCLQGLGGSGDETAGCSILTEGRGDVAPRPRGRPMTQGIPRDLGVTPWPGEGRAGFSHLGLAGELFVEEKEFED